MRERKKKCVMLFLTLDFALVIFSLIFVGSKKTNRYIDRVWKSVWML